MSVKGGVFSSIQYTPTVYKTGLFASKKPINYNMSLNQKRSFFPRIRRGKILKNSVVIKQEFFKSSDKVFSAFKNLINYVHHFVESKKGSFSPWIKRQKLLKNYVVIYFFKQDFFKNFDSVSWDDIILIRKVCRWLWRNPDLQLKDPLALYQQ